MSLMDRLTLATMPVSSRNTSKPAIPVPPSSPSMSLPLAVKASVLASHRPDTVHFSGQTPPQQNSWLKTFFMLALMLSGVPATSGFRPTTSDHKDVTEPEQKPLSPTHPFKTLVAVPWPESIASKPGGAETQVIPSEKTAFHHPPSDVTPPHSFKLPLTDPARSNEKATRRPVFDFKTATGEGEYQHGDLLKSHEEALKLAKSGKIAHEPDALKLITGPGHAQMFYEIRLKNGATVGLAIPEDTVQHEAFLKALKGDFHITPQPVPVSQSTLWTKLGDSAMRIGTLVALSGIVGLIQQALGAGTGVGSGQFKSTKASKKDEPADGEGEKPVTFADVRGYPEVIRELQRVKDRYLYANLKRSEVVKGAAHKAGLDTVGVNRIHVKPIKGLLLEGPPGTGKSMMARALAAESRVPFTYVSGSQFVEMYVGVGAARVRALFAKAKQDADNYGGAIVFIDELDSIGGKREMGSYAGGNEERTNALNELLQQMSGFSDDPRIMVLAATNRADFLDDALKRSGRFDKIIKVDLPHDTEQRRDILDKYLSAHPTAKALDRGAMAEFTQGKSGADLANLVNQMAEAAVDRINEARQDPAKVALLKEPEFQKLNTRDFMNALRNMEMGIPREARGTQDDRKTVAVHEVVGHGLVARAAQVAVQIVSMLPRGDALGHVITDPRSSSRKLPTLESKLKDLVISMGGRASESALLGPERITPGASGDIAQSKHSIRQMLATRMLSNASGADYDNPATPLNEQDRKLVDRLLKQAEGTAQEIIRKVPQEQLWTLVNRAMNLEDELEGDAANRFYQDVIDAVGVETLYQPIQAFIQSVINPSGAENSDTTKSAPSSAKSAPKHPAKSRKAPQEKAVPE
jgi:cell division protease FtsH